MANEIKQKYGSSTTLTVTLANLASSAGGGRQSTMVDNSNDRFELIHLFVKVKLGTNPNNNKTVQVYLLQGNGNGLRTDGAGATDAAITVKNAPLVGILDTGASAGTGDVLQGQFAIHDPGPEWGVAIVHDTGAALDGTPGNHAVEYVGKNPEIQ